MFGIEDPGIYLAYVAAIGCVIFALVFGIKRWNKDYDDETPKKRKS